MQCDWKVFRFRVRSVLETVMLEVTTIFRTFIAAILFPGRSSSYTRFDRGVVKHWYIYQKPMDNLTCYLDRISAWGNTMATLINHFYIIVATFVHHTLQKIVSSASLEGIFIVRRSTHSFLIPGLHGNINRNCTVVVIVWLRVGGSGFDILFQHTIFGYKLWKVYRFDIKCRCHNTNLPH